MTRGTQRFHDFMQRAFAPVRDVSHEHVSAVCGRVLDDVRDAAAHPSVETAGAQLPWAVPDSRFRHAFLAAAAVAVLAAAIGTAIVWPRGDQPLYQVVDGGVLALVDGSRVEVRPDSDVAVERAEDGLRIRLNFGGVIVHAAEQRSGHLYVQTRDMTVSVMGTVFLVNASEEGSRVAVIEGEVRVRLQGTPSRRSGRQDTGEQTLLPGQQVATASLDARPVPDAIAWSRHAPALLALMQQSAAVPPPVAPQNATASQAFELASVRPASGSVAPGARGGGPPPANGCGNGLVQVDPRRVVMNDVSLQWLIARAYWTWAFPLGGCHGIGNAGLLTGGPSWIRSDKWDIEALIPAGRLTDVAAGLASPDVQAMLRTLLADRFGLVLRPERKETAVLLLTVAAGGPKFNGPFLRPDGKPRVSVRQEPDGALTRAEDGLPVGTFRGVTQRNNDNPFILWEGHISMSEWAGWLNAEAGRPVIDRTRLEGPFRFHLEADPKGVSRPQLLQAIESLGLRLEAARERVDSFVIERADRPDAQNPQDGLEVASIRPTRYPRGGERGGGAGGVRPSLRPAGDSCGDHPNSFFLTFDPSRALISDMTVYGLIAWAYSIDCRTFEGSELLVGGPGWVRDEGFDIEALIPQGTQAFTVETFPGPRGRTGQSQRMTPQFRRMLQTLLAERFNLVLRREARQIPAYELVVSKGGRKLTPSKESDAQGTYLGVGLYDGIKNGINDRPEYKGMVVGTMSARKQSMAQFAARLGEMTSRPVFDRTGIEGVFTYEFFFAPDQWRAARRDPNDTRPTITSPSLFTVLEEELGLRLEEVKRPVDVWVIERAERPSDN